MKQAFAFLCLALVAGAARAEHVDINLSDEVLRAVYAGNLTGRMNGIYEFGGMLGERRDERFEEAHAGLLVTGDAGARKANVNAGLGGRVFAVHADELDGAGLALGGMFEARLPSFNRIGVVGYAYGAPEASTFGDIEGFLEYAVALDYQVLQGASIYVGYRQLKVDVEDYGTFTVDTGYHLGLHLSF
jgi:hypothetical protein